MTNTYIARFANGHIERKNVKAFDTITHAYRLQWIEEESGLTGDLYGFASSEAMAHRAALNVLQRKIVRDGFDLTAKGIEVISVGNMLTAREDGLDRYLKLYWAPKDMSPQWKKALVFRARFLVTGETGVLFYANICGQEHAISKKKMEIICFDSRGRRVNGGPIFAKDF